MSGIDAERCGERIRQRLDRSGTHLRHHDCGLRNHEVHLSGDEVGHPRTSATIRHEQQFCAGELLQQQSAHLRRRDLIDQFCIAGMRLHPGDEQLEVVGRKGFSR